MNIIESSNKNLQDIAGELVVNAKRMSCPYCEGSRTNLNGKRNDRQIYLCRDCGKQWREGGAMGGRSFPPDQIGAAIQMFYTGLSPGKAAEALTDQFGIKDAHVTPETIRKWVDRYTDAAIRLARHLTTPGGGKWWIFRQSTVTPRRHWLMALDDRTGYICANHVSKIGGDDRGMEAYLDALSYATKPVKDVVLLDMREELDWRSTVSSGVVPERRGEAKWIDDKWDSPIVVTNNFPPGFTVPKIFREYHAACARFERKDDNGGVQRHLAGWVITRNLFTKQRELGGRTPGQKARIKSPIASWADVVRLEARASLPAVGPKAAVTTRLPLPPSNDPRERG